jgi:hypothetical protein
MVVTMAKKKSAPKTEVGDDSRVVLMSVKGTEEFQAWFDELCDYLRLPKTVLFEHAVVAFAKAQGFPKPPPRR